MPVAASQLVIRFAGPVDRLRRLPDVNPQHVYPRRPSRDPHVLEPSSALEPVLQLGWTVIDAFLSGRIKFENQEESWPSTTGVFGWSQIVYPK